MQSCNSYKFSLDFSSYYFRSFALPQRFQIRLLQDFKQDKFIVAMKIVQKELQNIQTQYLSKFPIQKNPLKNQPFPSLSQEQFSQITQLIKSKELFSYKSVKCGIKEQHFHTIVKAHHQNFFNLISRKINAIRFDRIDIEDFYLLCDDDYIKQYIIQHISDSLPNPFLQKGFHSQKQLQMPKIKKTFTPNKNIQKIVQNRSKAMTLKQFINQPNNEPSFEYKQILRQKKEEQQKKLKQIEIKKQIQNQNKIQNEQNLKQILQEVKQNKRKIRSICGIIQKYIHCSYDCVVVEFSDIYNFLTLQLKNKLSSIVYLKFLKHYVLRNGYNRDAVRIDWFAQFVGPEFIEIGDKVMHQIFLLYQTNKFKQYRIQQPCISFFVELKQQLGKAKKKYQKLHWYQRQQLKQYLPLQISKQNQTKFKQRQLIERKRQLLKQYCVDVKNKELQNQIGQINKQLQQISISIRQKILQKYEQQQKQKQFQIQKQQNKKECQIQDVEIQLQQVQFNRKWQSSEQQQQEEFNKYQIKNKKKQNKNNKIYQSDKKYKGFSTSYVILNGKQIKFCRKCGEKSSRNYEHKCLNQKIELPIDNYNGKCTQGWGSLIINKHRSFYCFVCRKFEKSQQQCNSPISTCSFRRSLIPKVLKCNIAQKQFFTKINLIDGHLSYPSMKSNIVNVYADIFPSQIRANQVVQKRSVDFICKQILFTLQQIQKQTIFGPIGCDLIERKDAMFLPPLQQAFSHEVKFEQQTFVICPLQLFNQNIFFANGESNCSLIFKIFEEKLCLFFKTLKKIYPGQCIIVQKNNCNQVQFDTKIRVNIQYKIKGPDQRIKYQNAQQRIKQANKRRKQARQRKRQIQKGLTKKQ